MRHGPSHEPYGLWLPGRFGRRRASGWWTEGALYSWDFVNARYYQTTAPSCTRSTVGLAKTSAGALTSFSTNTARITNLGLLVEGGRTNLEPDSEAISAAPAWGSVGPTFSLNSLTTPAGDSTGDKLIEVNGSSTHWIYSNINPITANTVYCHSAFMKSIEREQGFLSFVTGGAGSGISLPVDMTLGAAGIHKLYGTGSFTQSYIEEFNNSFWRASISGKIDATSTDGYVVINPDDGTMVAMDGAYTGNGTSGIGVWGVQTELSSFPSSYIVTAGATAARGADAVTKSVSGAGPLTVVVTGHTAMGVDSADQVIFQWDDGSEDNRIRIFRDSSRVVRCIATVSTAAQCNLNLGMVGDDTDFSIAFAVATNDFSGILDYGTPVTDTSGTAPSGLTTMRFGHDTADDYMFGYIKTVEVF